MLFYFQLAAKNSPELNALSSEYGSGWEVRVPLMRTGGCICHPSTAEQQRLDRQHLHDDDHPDPSTLFYTHDQLIQLRVSDQMEPVRGEQRALAFRGARRQRNQVMKWMILKYRSQNK